MRALPANGADPNADDGWPGTPLCAAAEFGSPAVVAELAQRASGSH